MNLTSAASKFPLYVVAPFVVVAPAAGFATTPVASLNAPAAAPSDPCGFNTFLGAARSEYQIPVGVYHAYRTHLSLDKDALSRELSNYQRAARLSKSCTSADCITTTSVALRDHPL